MRISDWSSDVCSSDLPTAASSADLRDRKHSFNISLLRPDAKVSRDSIEVRWRAATSPADRPLYSGTPALLSPSTKTSQWANLARCRRTKSEEHTSELQSLMRISYAVFCLKKKKT